MQTHNSNYFNAYKFLCHLLLILIGCFFLACSRQNNTKQVLPVQTRTPAAAPVVNINAATFEDLEKLPHIGKRTALEIVAHREKYGKFRKPEHLLLIQGISDKKFREIRSLVAVE